MNESQNSDVSRRTFAALAGTAALSGLIPENVVAAPPEGAKNPNGESDRKLTFPPKPDAEICSRFGYRLATLAGTKTKVWLAATEDDYRKSEARRTGKAPADIVIKKAVEKDGELVLDYDSCALGQSGNCIGGCTDGGCRKAVNGDYVYCYCQKS